VVLTFKRGRKGEKQGSKKSRELFAQEHLSQERLLNYNLTIRDLKIIEIHDSN
jgi:hypothetical protein